MSTSERDPRQSPRTWGEVRQDMTPPPLSSRTTQRPSVPAGPRRAQSTPRRPADIHYGPPGACIDDNPPDRQNALSETISCLASAVVHMLAMIVLALFGFSATADPASVTLIAHETDAPEPFLAVDVFAHEVSVPAAAIVDSIPQVLERAAVAVDTLTEAVDVQLDASLAPGNASARNVPLLASVAFHDLLQPVGIAEGGSGSVIIEGPPLRGADTPASAVNGLGGDIAGRLESGSVLVVWMFDASLSMHGDRIAAGRQMGIVFREIAERLQETSYRARHALLCFGNGSLQMHAPTDNWIRITRQVPRIPNDLSGVENVFTALRMAIPEYRKSWDEQLLFVVWTDESGDDVDQLEETIALCRQQDVAVCVVGPTAVLGRRTGAQFFHVPQVHPYQGYLPVDRGPDAGVPQLLGLPHWFGKALPVYGGLLPNSLPSGFGPYHLVRLTQATGGSYTNYDRAADRAAYQVEDLLDYLPDYRAAKIVRDQAWRHPLRRAVVEAAEATARAAQVHPPRFDPNDDPEFHFWLPPHEYQPMFCAVVRKDLQDVKTMRPLVEKAYKILSRDELDEALKSEKSPRWRASYLLARGRAAAMMVRSREYETLADAILGGKAFRSDTTLASIQCTSRLQTESWGNQLHHEAWDYLQRCQQEHAQTPWAELARWERRYSLGLELRQRVTVPSGVSSGPAPGRIPGPSI